MEDKLITLVTLTYAKAEILKSVLESEGIMSELYNVNVIQPFVSSGVKVRINEKDLTVQLSGLSQRRNSLYHNEILLPESKLASALPNQIVRFHTDIKNLAVSVLQINSVRELILLTVFADYNHLPAADGKIGNPAQLGEHNFSCSVGKADGID